MYQPLIMVYNHMESQYNLLSTLIPMGTRYSSEAPAAIPEMSRLGVGFIQNFNHLAFSSVCKGPIILTK